MLFQEYNRKKVRNHLTFFKTERMLRNKKTDCFDNVQTPPKQPYGTSIGLLNDASVRT